MTTVGFGADFRAYFSALTITVAVPLLPRSSPWTRSDRKTDAHGEEKFLSPHARRRACADARLRLSSY